MAILWRTLAVPPRPQGTRFFPSGRGDQATPPLREERSSGWRAGQWEAKTAAQRGEAVECKHSQERCEPRVSPRVPHWALGAREAGCVPYPSAAMLWDVYLSFCSRLLTEVRINPIFPLSAHPPCRWATLHLATLPLPGGFPLCTGNARAILPSLLLSTSNSRAPEDITPLRSGARDGILRSPRVRCLSRCGARRRERPHHVRARGTSPPRPAAASRPSGARASGPRGRQQPASEKEEAGPTHSLPFPPCLNLGVPSLPLLTPAPQDWTSPRGRIDDTPRTGFAAGALGRGPSNGTNSPGVQEPP